MTRYLARRVGLSAIVVAGVVVLTFFITRVIPGDPAASWAGPHASPAEIAAIRHKLGLDQPVWRQIGTYFKGIVTGDWGVSVHTHQPDGLSARIVWPGTLQTMAPLGDRVRLTLTGPQPAVVDVTPSAVAELGLHPGHAVWVTAKATDVAAYPDSPAARS